MKKLILSVAVMFAMSSFSVFAQDAKPAKKESTKTEQCCKKDAKKDCCKKDAKAADKACCKKDGEKKTSTKADAKKK
jgi:hypothetical protein